MPAPKRKQAPPLTDAEVFTLVGQALFPVDDWPSLTGNALGLSKQAVRNIRRDANDLYPEVAAEMLALVEARLKELTKARDMLRAWEKQRS